MKVVGLLLAGGLSRRMGGGDKALRLLGAIALLDRVIARLRTQVDDLVLNANGEPASCGSPCRRSPTRYPASPARLAGGEEVDLADPLLDQRVAQILAQPHRP